MNSGPDAIWPQCSIANKLLGLLKRTCPFLTEIQVPHTLYLAIVKSQLCYAGED